jgi:hypothetical protein
MSAPQRTAPGWAQWLLPAASVALAILAGVVYGLLTRMAFGSGNFSNLFSTLSVAFLFLTPLGLGAVTVALAPPALRRNWFYAVLAPLVTVTIFIGLVAVLLWEAIACLVMALPLFICIGPVGGALACLVFVLLARRSQAGTVGLLALVVFSPYAAAPIESLFPVADEARTVHSQIEVFASPETVWANITRVRAITPEEHRFSWFHLAGLPRPVEATLTAGGVGGVRRGQWEDGLAFIETITEWEAGRSYTMAMEADASQATNARLPLRDIGGQHFDVVSGRYEIEVLGPEHVIVHFTSTHRLSTRFNAYGGWWTDLFMRDVQDYILAIVKERSEAG